MNSHCQKWSKWPTTDISNKTPNSIMLEETYNTWWQIYYIVFLPFWSDQEFVLTCIAIYSEYGFAFLVSTHWLGPTSVSLWNIWSMDKESLRILYQTSEHIWTKNAIQDIIFLSLIAPPRSPLACRRYTGHNSSKEIFCKNSMPHPGSLTCIEKNVYFALFLQRTNTWEWEAKYENKSILSYY